MALFRTALRIWKYWSVLRCDAVSTGAVSAHGQRFNFEESHHVEISRNFKRIHTQFTVTLVIALIADSKTLFVHVTTSRVILPSGWSCRRGYVKPCRCTVRHSHGVAGGSSQFKGMWREGVVTLHETWRMLNN